jgi:hypothetical protein
MDRHTVCARKAAASRQQSLSAGLRGYAIDD